MSEHVSEIQNISVAEIRIINPRVRNKKVFNDLVTSISHIGLKRPITVSKKDNSSGFDLVCGQGRLEAFIALKQNVIPAIVIEASIEDCFIMSLVENLARRQQTSLEFVREIGALRERGYSNSEIAKKTDFSEEYVYALCYLLDNGEDRLLLGVERGIIPPSIAMEICRAKDADVQKALAEAYETKAIPGNQIVAIRRIVEQRNSVGKQVKVFRNANQPVRKITADALVRAYQRETERQKLLVKKATLAQHRLLFIVNALKNLLSDEHFVTLLRAEAIHSMPSFLAERVGFGAN